MKIAAITMLPGNPPLCHDKKEGRSPPPTPHPTIHLNKIVLSLYYTGWEWGEGGAGQNLRVNDRGGHSSQLSYNEKEDRSHPHHSPPTITHPSKYVHTVLKMVENGGDGDEKVEKLR